uniref:Small ribosomal subunit protein uS8c n=1 Tax=Megaloselaginella exaltata TaxID=3140882 RepID=A0A7T8FZX8_9TRAC|nr:ribosomal protein S8 [Selaginella exaltata]
MSNDALDSTTTAIMNTGHRGAPTLRVPSTNVTMNVGRTLVEEGFLENPREHLEGTNRLLVLTLGYRGRLRKPYITKIARLSKPGLRIYSHYEDIPRVLGGLGTVILSTSSGGMVTDREARRKRIGGEVPRHAR